ncbi:hypothetical protein HAX54_045378, partial [Datura stramonium]|nr:hypothetical protein [Datura stramonium]
GTALICCFVRNCDIGVHGDELRMMAIDYSLVGSGEMLMECWFGLILALGHCLEPALHQYFTDQDRRIEEFLLIRYLLPQFSVSHWRFSGGPQIPSCGSS